MSMRNCNNCLENNWKFELLPDCFIRATCQMCSHEVEFQSKKLLEKKKRVEENPDYSGGTVTYKMRDGKIFNEGQEVDVYRNFSGCVQIKPVKMYTAWEKVV